jgi:hypothetical protein
LTFIARVVRQIIGDIVHRTKLSSTIVTTNAATTANTANHLSNGEAIAS